MTATIIFEERETQTKHRLGLAILKAEKSLNALTLSMVQALNQQLTLWENDPSVVCIVIRGYGNKAFCAGGDICALREAILADPKRTVPNPYALAFFREEYTLDYHVHTYQKPIIVWGNGIVMGGGLGLLVGASHRVVTPSTRMAMPEITIGLFPDVGASWFLQRLPAKIGLFLGLTGASLNAHDAIITNLADYIVSAERWLTVIDQLTLIAWDNDALDHHQRVSKLLNSLALDVVPSAAKLNPHLPTILGLMNQDLLSCAQSLNTLAFEDAWLAEASRVFSAGCPTSAALTWELQKRTRHLSLADTLRLELTVALHACAKPDFREGVRAQLVDKDYKPIWQYKTLAHLDKEWVLSHFQPLWPTLHHPLAQLV